MRGPECCVRFYEWLPYTTVAAVASTLTSGAYSLFLNTACSVRTADNDDYGVTRLFSAATGALSALSKAALAAEVPTTMCDSGEGTVCCYGRHSSNITMALSTLTVVLGVTYVVKRILCPSTPDPSAATSPTHGRSQSAPEASYIAPPADDRDA